jgi:hypothetical protein
MLCSPITPISFRGGEWSTGAAGHTETRRVGRPSAATAVVAATAQFRHALGFLTVFGAVLAELSVHRDRAGTTRMGALLRLVHERLLLLSPVSIVAQARACRAVRARGAARPHGAIPRTRRARAGLPSRPVRAAFAECCTSPCARRSASRTRRKYAHAGAVRPSAKTVFSGSTWILPFGTLPETEIEAGRFAESLNPAGWAVRQVGV